ncbi:type VI secretion system accessory protein TagJ [Kalamiella sp. sgz302252]|uniref:type VI secretion system accessory protein TagJ n=1 Tax=Pantoea sp. sgz302252 TaxID=3341827 RepID=UPI0036D3B5CA
MKSLTELMSGATLAETLARVESDIKSRPADADLRAAFVQLLCLAGHWPRAKTQLKSWLALKPQAQPTVTLLEQCITAEIQRAAVFEGQAMPRMPGEAFAWAEDLLKALRKEHAEEADELRAAAFEAASASPASITLQNEQVQTAEWLIDGDGRLGPICELIVNGHYTWLPFAAISEIRFQAPASVTDLVWRHAAVTLIDGSEQVCQLPVRYPFADTAADNLRLAAVTEWTPLDDQQFIGHGQKTWLSEEGDFPLLSLTHIAFGVAEENDE